ncbi:MAG: Putative cFMN hydrolase [uncultured Solirubrobacteraceae bacterium]|uniref:CFMN hydrolase n=1 Tax=uncultured Solirubrobacteraceae bacterium TaxID=1162706 RepID=A0A6J4T730_9ACTN|nr:MAG: Putative cFMN hydrolase [uncultured Solirubrobacteraceae bacterium]
MTAIAAVVFDMDGVLVDSEERWDRARRELVAETGGTWRDDATHAMMGMSSPEWSAYVRDELGVPLSAPEINTRVVEHLLAGYEEGLPLIPGAVEAVRRVAALGRPLGLASSSNREVIDLVLERAGLADLFSATVSSEEVARGKPSPDVYLEALRRLGVAPEAATAVEDSSNGLRAAAAAGMRVVAIPHPAFPPAADALALAHVVLAGPDALDAAAVLGP